MGRPKGSRNKRTLLKEAEQYVGTRYADQVLDALYVIEKAMRHFFIRAEMAKKPAARTSKLTRTTSELRLLLHWRRLTGIRSCRP